MSDWAKELLADVAHEVGQKLDEPIVWNDETIARVLERRLLGLLEALEAVAPNEHAGEYESEYDGRTYMMCLGCSYNQDEPYPEHRKDCAYVLACAAKAVASEGKKSL